MIGNNRHKLYALQTEFAASIRDPAVASLPPGVAEDRMSVYQELFFNNVAGALESAFPVAQTVVDEALWRQLLGAFWREHRSHTPEYPRLSGEFITWLTEDKAAHYSLPPWFSALLVWEHAELDAILEEDDPPCAQGSLLGGVPVVTRSLRQFAFDYPVQRVSADWQPETPEPTFLACYRGRQDEIGFLSLSPASAVLLEQLRESSADTSSLTGEAHIQQLAATLALAAEDIRGFAEAFLDDLQARGVVLGVRPQSEVS